MKLRLLNLAVITIMVLAFNYAYSTELSEPITVKMDSEHFQSIHIGDFTGSGADDLIVNEIGGALVLYVSKHPEDGYFEQRKGLPLTSGSNYSNDFVASMAHADLNNDGTQDFIAGTSCGISFTQFPVYLNDGTGTFARQPCVNHSEYNPNLDTNIVSIATGDLNNDGNQDLAIALTGNYSKKVMLVYLGNGDGLFQPYQTVYDNIANNTIGLRPNRVAIGDFGGDGNLDIVLETATTSSTTNFLYTGDGQGNFVQSDYLANFPNQDPYKDSPLHADASALYLYDYIVSDFTGDGLGDIVNFTHQRKFNSKINLYVQIDPNATTPPPTGGGNGDGNTGDDEPPEVEILDPEEPISGTYTFITNSSDNVGVDTISFSIDGVFIGAVSAPFTVTVDTSAYSNGLHIIDAIASDAAGNTGSFSLEFTVGN